MNFTVALSTSENTADALEQVCAEIRLQLAGSADLAIAFISPHHADQAEKIAAAICDATRTDNGLGCTGESIAGADREVEEKPAIALWVAQMPGVNVPTFHLSFERHADGGLFTGWPTALADELPATSA